MRTMGIDFGIILCATALSLGRLTTMDEYGVFRPCVFLGG